VNKQPDSDCMVSLIIDCLAGQTDDLCDKVLVSCYDLHIKVSELSVNGSEFIDYRANIDVFLYCLVGYTLGEDEVTHVEDDLADEAFKWEPLVSEIHVGFCRQSENSGHPGQLTDMSGDGES
jgi:hypothetical protein